MALENEILRDLEEVGGSKQKLMQKYGEEMTTIRNMHGGNISDIPANSDHPYHELQRKLTALGRMTL